MNNVAFFSMILIVPAIGYIYCISSYKKYKQCKIKKKLTGQEVASEILEANNLEEIYVVETQGMLSDHYDSSRKVIRLSSEVFHQTNVASMSIAAQKTSLALQDEGKCILMKLRSLVYPIISLATRITYIILLSSFVFEIVNLLTVGIAILILGLIVMTVILLTEIDANKRGLENLKKLYSISKKESDYIQKMLNAATMTYILGIIAIIINLVRLF